MRSRDMKKPSSEKKFVADAEKENFALS